MLDAGTPLQITDVKIGRTQAMPPVEAPIIAVDTSRRSDVLDSCRAVARAGGGLVQASWHADSRPPTDTLLLSVRIFLRRECRFRVELILPEQVDVTRILVGAERVIIAMSPIPKDGHMGPATALEVDVHQSHAIVSDAVVRVERRVQ
jgi:hypothetical protein